MIVDNTQQTKHVKAISTATYRRVEIITTNTGFTFFWSGRQYDNLTLGEATAAIDAIYARLVDVISPAGARKQ